MLQRHDLPTAVAAVSTTQAVSSARPDLPSFGLRPFAHPGISVLSRFGRPGCQHSAEEGRSRCPEGKARDLVSGRTPGPEAAKVVLQEDGSGAHARPLPQT